MVLLARKVKVYCRIKLTLKYDQKTEYTMFMEKFKLESKCIRGPDKFLSDFNKSTVTMNTFAMNSCGFLLQLFVAKLSVNPNPQWDTGTFNFYLALAITGNCKGYEFVAGILEIMSLRHFRRIFPAERIPPFSNLTTSAVIESLVSYLITVQKAMDTSKWVSFTVGVDATIVVKSWNIIQSHRSIFGGDSPN